MNTIDSATAIHNKTIGVFITCLVNPMRPSVGFATLDLLEKVGCDYEVPDIQGCCGQPAFNSGDDQGTRAIAKQLITVFEKYDFVVIPSGSCAGMIRKNFPEIFQTNDSSDQTWYQRAQMLSNKTHELLSFLVDHCCPVRKI